MGVAWYPPRFRGRDRLGSTPQRFRNLPGRGILAYPGEDPVSGTFSPIHLLFFLTGLVVLLFWGLFCLTSQQERRVRAAILSGVVCLGFGGSWFGSFWLLQPPAWILASACGTVFLLAALFFLPLGRGSSLEIGEITGRVDERDVMFSREEYQPGTDRYEAYYALRPEWRDRDDRIRKQPELLEPGGKYFDPVRSANTAALFRNLEDLTPKVDGPLGEAVPEDLYLPGDGTDPAANTAVVKKLVTRLGADEVGVARLDQAFVYSHVGRGPEPWGTPITNQHDFAVIFTIEMAYPSVEQAPRIDITEETARQYLLGATISINLARQIRRLGFPARAQIAGSNYQIMLPPVAHDAGLGELGRFGYLVSRRFGARVRLGAVTTDLPLLADRPVRFGVLDFCRICRRCAENCPSGSIPGGDRQEVRGVKKWPLEVESCLHYWRYLGTDCGLCMKVCPFSHPRALVHDLVRYGISRSSFARRVSLFGEDLFYGRRYGP